LHRLKPEFTFGKIAYLRNLLHYIAGGKEKQKAD
jgi:hypothetical protein